MDLTLVKSKINLSDYDYKKDIENRLLMSTFSTQDLSILEEILYSPLSVSMYQIATNLSLTDDELIPSLKKLSQTGLFEIDNFNIIINKQMRKYYEFQFLKFNSQFKPDLEFSQNLLKKVPIHVLPFWYSISKTSDNIFYSIIEKYLKTPSIFQKHIEDVKSEHDLLKDIIDELYKSKELKLKAKDIIEKHQITRDELEEILLILEFNFTACLSYEKDNDHYEEIITPFHEWNEYLNHLKQSDIPSITNLEINIKRDDEFGFIKDIVTILHMCQKTPLNIVIKDNKPSLTEDVMSNICQTNNISDNYQSLNSYFSEIIDRICLIKFAEINNDKLFIKETAKEWLSMDIETKALHLYRHPLNHLTSISLSALYNEDAIREAEKSITRAFHKGWVYFDDFVKASLAPLTKEQNILLKQIGTHWTYNIPNYSEDEKNIIKAAIFETLFEAGIVKIGKLDNKDCFCITKFGHHLFE